jgi:hypothetical protein
VKLTTHIHLVTRLRIGGVIPLLPFYEGVCFRVVLLIRHAKHMLHTL